MANNATVHSKFSTKILLNINHYGKFNRINRQIFFTKLISLKKLR